MIRYLVNLKIIPLLRSSSTNLSSKILNKRSLSASFLYFGPKIENRLFRTTSILCQNKSLIVKNFHTTRSFMCSSKFSELVATNLHIFRSFSSSANAADQTSSSTSTSEQDSSGKKQSKLKWQIWAPPIILTFGFFTFTIMWIYNYGNPERDEVGAEIIDEYSHLPWLKQRLYRAYGSLILYIKTIQEPSRDVLLPDPLKPPYYQPKYTVVLELNGVLVHPEWTFNTGWRFKKRQGVDYFLKSLAYPRCELVVYTSENGLTAHAIVDNLDAENNIMYRLYRDSTKYEDGAHIKVLSKLNRDMSKVIFIDWDTNGFKFNPENALRVKKWSGDDDDLDLVDLAHLIRTVIELDIQDVRPVLQYYSSCDDPVKAFRENAKRLQV